MRDYEMMVILSGELPDDERSAMLDTIQQWVETAGGTVEKADHWGRRHMTYEIDGQRDGYYVVYTLDLPVNAPAELERNMRLNENVLRYLITRQE